MFEVKGLLITLIWLLHDVSMYGNMNMYNYYVTIKNKIKLVKKKKSTDLEDHHILCKSVTSEMATVFSGNRGKIQKKEEI